MPGCAGGVLGHDGQMESFDSLLNSDAMTGACAVLLFIAAIGAWNLAGSGRAAIRLYQRLAAMLLSGLAVCAGLAASGAAMPGLGDAAALILMPLVAAALGAAVLARFARRLPDLLASLLLAGALALGLASALTGWAMLAVVPVVLAGLLTGALALGGGALLAMLGAMSLVASALALLQQGAGGGMLLFAAAAIVGLCRSAQAVDQAIERPRGGGRAPVGGLR